MKFFSYFVKSSVLFGIVLFSLLTFASNEQKQPSFNGESKISYLFIQSASKAVIEQVPSHPDQYQLILTQIQPFVSYFSDRPNRITGIIPVNQFLDIWKNGNNSFSKVPPNVGVSGSKIHGFFNKTATSFVLELSHPRYDLKNKSLSYDVKFLSSNKPSDLSSTIILQNATLFFDDMSCPSCCCGK